METKTRDTAAAAKQEVATTKNDDRGINDCNTTRQTELQ